MDRSPQLSQQLAAVADRAWFCPAALTVRQALRAAVGIISPAWCIGCAEQDTVLCELCAEDLHLLTRTPFAAEQQALALPLLFEDESITVMPVSAAGRYAGLLARAVLAYKDHGAITLADALSPGLVRALRLAVDRTAGSGPNDPPSEPTDLRPVHLDPAQSPPWLLVSPPSSLRSQLMRGFDPVQVLLTRALTSPQRELDQGERRLRHAPGLLRQRRSAALRSLNPRHGRQKTRGARARRLRTVGSVEVTPRGRRELPGAQVLLVDDVLTSGSTLAELHRVLSAAGARVHGAAVLAAAPGPGAGAESVLMGASPEA